MKLSKVSNNLTTGSLDLKRDDVSSIYSVFEVKMCDMKFIYMFIGNTFYLAHFEFEDPVNRNSSFKYFRTVRIEKQVRPLDE